jgi:hypothetical protein
MLLRVDAHDVVEPESQTRLANGQNRTREVGLSR